MKKTKAALRAECLNRRRSLSEESRAEAGVRAAEILLAQPLKDMGTVISGYWPLHGEFDVRPVFLSLGKAGFTLALPVIETAKAPLIFRRYVPGDTLLKDTKHDIYEPLSSAQILVPEVLLVPLVAFDRNGFRLGLGGGYYDRTLAGMSKRITIGVGYADAEVEKIPNEAHDVKMDYILTEKEWIKVA